MPKFNVVVVSLGYASYATEREILKPIDAELVLAPSDCLTEAEVVAAAREADAILVREAPVGARVIDALPRLRAIVRYGVGVDNIDLAHARERRVYVANVPGYGTEEVSDHAAALLLACIRSLRARDDLLRGGRLRDRHPGPDLPHHRENPGAARLRPHRPGAAPQMAGLPPAARARVRPHGCAGGDPRRRGEPVELDTLFAESDYLSLHAPLTPQTRHVVNAASLGRMKPTAILVNTARGELIDETALVAALDQGTIGGAGLDVFEREPLAPGHPLLSAPHTLLTGHVGWYSKDAVQELQTRGAQEVVRVLSGGVPECWVNRW